MNDEEHVETLSKKELKKIHRQEKIDSRTHDQQSRQMKKMIGWGIAVILIALIGYGLSLIPKTPVLPEMGEAFTVQPVSHIPIGSSHAAYNSNPPTSGPHYEQPAKWGIYNVELPDEQLVHNLEHGGIWISYKDIDASTKTALEKIADTRVKIILTPRSKNDAPITLASWGYLLKLQSYDEATIQDFITRNSNKSPEPFAQ